MFEAVVTICLSLQASDAAGQCRDVLLPGYEAADKAGCQAALVQRPPKLAAEAKPFCQAAGPALEVSEVAPGIFIHEGAIAEPDQVNKGDATNLGFIIGDDSVAVIDTGSARWMGEDLWRAIRARTDKPVSYVILTHMHPDHVLGASAFAGTGAVFVGHPELARALADRRDAYLSNFGRLIGAETFIGTEIPHIDQVVEDETQIDLGGRVLELKSWPLAHTATDMTVFDPQTGTLLAGDLVFDQHCPAIDGSLRGWQAVLETLTKQPAARVVPGHGGPVLDWPAGAAPLQRYLAALAEETKAAIESGERLGEAITHVGSDLSSDWQLCDTFTPRNATVAYTELEWE